MTKEFAVLVIGSVSQLIFAMLYPVYRAFTLENCQGRGWNYGTGHAQGIFILFYLFCFLEKQFFLFLPALFTYMTLFGFLFPFFKKSWSREQSNTFREGVFLSLLVFLASFGVVYAISSTG